MDFGDVYRRFRRGVRVLDEKLPRWRTVMRKHMDEFNFEDCNYCVLGTLGKHTAEIRKRATDDAFGDALKFLTRESHGSSRWGFDAVAGHTGEEYPALTALWEAEIEGVK